jgi:hypothetical protein
VAASSCKGTECKAYAAGLRDWAAKDATCWDASQACQSIPCTTDAAAGWCKSCAFYKQCSTLKQKAPAAL